MTEHEMEDLLWNHPERFLGERLRHFRRQDRTAVGRSDLIFEDRLGTLVIVEIKKDVERASVGQICDYFAALKREFPLRSVELMLVANRILDERRVALERLGIECWHIPAQRFRVVAHEVGYPVTSEEDLIGSGDIGEFGAVMVRYGPNAGGAVPGEYPAVVTAIGHNQIEVMYYYDDGSDPDSVTLERDDNGNWRDITYDVPVTINRRPPASIIEDLKRRVASSG
jgi:hypothetical protein